MQVLLPGLPLQPPPTRTAAPPANPSASPPDAPPLTASLLLPHFEKDIPFNADGYPNNQPPVTKSLFKRLGNTLRSN